MSNIAIAKPSIFNFNKLPVTTFSDDHGEPWFLANDVCTILGYRNPRDAVAKHCKAKGVAKRDTPTSSGNQEMTFISEGNLFRLIVKSRKPEAEKFEELVMDEILPTIRKTGQYQAPNLKTKKALPNGLSIDQCDSIKALVKARAEALPKDKQAKATITCWSALKSKFGCTYKAISPEYFHDAVSLVARLPLEGELIPAEPAKGFDVEAALAISVNEQIDLPNDIIRAIDQRAFYLAHEAFELTRNHLLKRVIYEHGTDLRASEHSSAKILETINRGDLGYALTYTLQTTKRHLMNFAGYLKHLACDLEVQITDLARSQSH